MRKGFRLLMPMICCLLVSPALAQTSEEFVPHILPTLDIRRAAGSIDIDGNLDDAGWMDAARADGFTETYPGDGVRPGVTTEVRLAYDDYNLYVAFICQDDPKEVQAYLHNRDMMQNEDQVGIFIDTYGDADNAVAFFSNALGVQEDNLAGYRNQYDQFYLSSGKLTDNGYQVELAIPFSSLRFPNTTTQNWRINLQRIRPRESSYTYAWAATSRDNSCLPCQYGTLTGLHDLQLDHQLELLPTVTAQDVTSFSRRSHTSSGILTTGSSLVARYLPAPNISISAALAPEIGDLNVSDKTLWYQEFSPWWSLSLPMAEHRLLKDDSHLAEYSPFNTFVSGIEADAAAIIATGRFGHTSVKYQGGYLENDESHSESILHNYSLTNELYVRQSLSDDSYIGAAINHTDWRDGGATTSVGSVGQLRLLEHTVFWWDVNMGRSVEPVDSTTWNSDSPLNGEVRGGYGLSVGIDHSSRHWSSQIFYINDGTAFRAGLSPLFTTRAHNLFASTSYIIYPGTAAIEQIIPSITVSWSKDIENKGENIYAMPAIWLLATRQTGVWLRYSFNQVRGEELTNSYHAIDISLRRYFGPRINLGIYTRYSHDYNDSQLMAKNLSIGLSADLIPFPSLMIGWSLSYYEHRTIQETLQHYINWSNSISYQLIEKLSAMLDIGYDGDRLSLDPFLVYRFNVYSSISLGSTHRFQKISYDANTFSETTRQFFLKAQYFVGL